MSENNDNSINNSEYTDRGMSEDIMDGLRGFGYEPNGFYNWGIFDLELIFPLYCKTPYDDLKPSHPAIAEYAKLLGRDTGDLARKLRDFGYFDDELMLNGYSIDPGTSVVDKKVWDEYHENWEDMVYKSEKHIAKVRHSEIRVPGLKKNQTVNEEFAKRKIIDDFFKRTVLASYKNVCCITGLCNKEFVTSIHIKPLKDCSENERTDPRNGICLNALFAKAFVNGFITIDTEYRVHVSRSIRDTVKRKAKKQLFLPYDNQEIILPEKFLPNKEYLAYHKKFVYEHWKKEFYGTPLPDGVSPRSRRKKRDE